MKIFHIDMNTGHFTGEYLKKWLAELAKMGYDTILWELENSVQWDTCPECSSTEAFTKAEFRELLDLCQDLGLESIPLFQTLGHSTYVMKSEKYHHLSECGKGKGQFCALNPDVKVFLEKWIEEYVDLFGSLNLFHMGADEAGGLGRCEQCAEFVEKHSKSELFVDFVNAIAEIVISKGVRPVMWADMMLHHNDAIDKLSRKIVMFDWQYNIRRDNDSVMLWELRKHSCAADIPSSILEKYGKYMFPYGNEKGRNAEVFYSTDYLMDKGFDIVGCPSSSCAGDSIWAPQNWLRMINTFDWTRKGLECGNMGTCVTSWTVRLNLWETQLATMNITPYITEHPEASIGAYQQYFIEKQFGVNDDAYWVGCGKFSKLCVFMDARSLGYYKHAEPTPAGHIAKVIAGLKEDNQLSKSLRNCCDRLDDYKEGLRLLCEFRDKATKSHDVLDIWVLMARNHINRAKASIIILQNAGALIQEEDQDEVAVPELDKNEVLKELQGLRIEMQELYKTIIKPKRAELMMHWMYDAVTDAIAGE